MTVKTVRVALLTMLVAAVGVMTAVPALAHPFGPPLAAEVEGGNYVVNLKWMAADDDWLALARHVGVFEETPEEMDGEPLSGAQRIAMSEGVSEYVLDAVTVTQVGNECGGEVVYFEEDFPESGIILQFSCEDMVYEVDIEMNMLTDLHPAYRTIATAATGANPPEALFNQTNHTHTFDFGAVEGASEIVHGGAGDLPWEAILAVAALVLVAGVVLWRGFRSPKNYVGGTKDTSVLEDA